MPSLWPPVTTPPGDPGLTSYRCSPGPSRLQDDAQRLGAESIFDWDQTGHFDWDPVVRTGEWREARNWRGANLGSIHGVYPYSPFLIPIFLGSHLELLIVCQPSNRSNSWWQGCWAVEVSRDVATWCQRAGNTPRIVIWMGKINEIEWTWWQASRLLRSHQFFGSNGWIPSEAGRSCVRLPCCGCQY